MTKFLFTLLFPTILFSQQNNDWHFFLQKALNNMDAKDFESAKLNLEKSIRLNTLEPKLYYLKGVSEIKMNQKSEGCQSIIHSLYLNFYNATKFYEDNCINFNPKLNINKFKTGNFTYHLLGPSKSSNDFERKNDIEYSYFDEFVFSDKIVWLENGDYKVLGKGNQMDNDPKFFTRVLKIVGNEYLYAKFTDKDVSFGIVQKND